MHMKLFQNLKISMLCYSLDLECPSKAHVVKGSSSISSTNSVTGGESFSRVGPTGVVLRQHGLHNQTLFHYYLLYINNYVYIRFICMIYTYVFIYNKKNHLFFRS
jgi:hypothetical protein